MTKRIVILGASGFVGQNLMQRLASEGHQVVAIGRTKTTRPPVSNVATHTLEADAYEKLPSVADALIGGMDAIINCVAYGVRPTDRDAQEMVQLNVHLPVKLVDIAAKSSSALIHLGSSAEYAPANREVALTETSALETERMYGTSKQAGTTLAMIANRSLGGRLAVLRLFNVYGPHEAEHRLFPSLMKKLQAKDAITLSSGLQVRDFIHVDDVVSAVSHTLDIVTTSKSEVTDAFNICTSKGQSVRQFAETVCDAMGAPRALLQFGKVPLRPDDLPWLVGDNSVIADQTGWHPKMTINKAVHTLMRQQGAVR